MSASPRIVLFVTREVWAEDNAGMRALLVRLHDDDTVLRIEDLGPDDLGESDLVVVVSPASAPRLASPVDHRGEHVGYGPRCPGLSLPARSRHSATLLHAHTGARRRGVGSSACARDAATPRRRGSGRRRPPRRGPGVCSPKRLMAHDFSIEEDLLDRLTAQPYEAVFLVGSAVTAPARAGEPGVPRVDGVIAAIRSVYTQPRELERFDRALAVEPHNRYQAAFRHLQVTRGQDLSNAIIRRCVLQARVPSAKYPQVHADIGANAAQLCRGLEEDIEGWHLPPAVQALGQILARTPVKARPVVLTSNFDPLVTVSVRRAGGHAYTTALHSDGGFAAIDGLGTLVVHVHGDWSRSDTLPTPVQLGQDRPRLAASLRQLLSERTLVVLGYGGWDDILTRSLIQAIREIASIDVLWTFYGGDDAQLARGNAELLANLGPWIERARVMLYKGIDAHAFLPRLAEELGARPASDASARGLPQPPSAAQEPGDMGFLATPFESVRGVTRSASVEQVYLNVWFPKFEPRAPKFVVDQPIDMHVDLGPQRHGAHPDPISESLKDRLRRLARIDVWVQCADADVTPGDGTLELPWPTNVLTFQLVPRRPGGLRIVVVLLIKNQPVHRLEREVQVQDRGARWA